MPIPVGDLDDPQVNLYWLAWIDINGEPVRATTLPYPVTPSGTGDADLDGFTFLSLDSNLVDISPVVHQRGGSDSVTATLSGLPGVDDDFIAAVATKANWQGRTARLWHGVFTTPAAYSAPYPYYTGYINRLSSLSDPANRTVMIEIENYLALLTTPRGRSYGHNTEHDSGDLSPLRMRSAANGTTGSGIPLSAPNGGRGVNLENNERLL